MTIVQPEVARNIPFRF